MTAPRWIARANRYLTNPVLEPLVYRLPGFGVLAHTGRKSGRHYRTPVKVFRRGNSYLIALTYGPRSDWVQNVLASGEARLESRGQTVRLSRPRIIHDERRRLIPAPAHVILGLLGVSDFMTLDAEATCIDRKDHQTV